MRLIGCRPFDPYTRFGIAAGLYILFVVWLGNYWFLFGLPIVFDIYISKRVNLTFWKKRGTKNHVVIEWLDVFTRGYDGRALTFVQIATMAACCGFGSLLFEPVSWPQVWTGSLISALLITSVFATVYAFWAMTTFQNRTTPTRAALIYTLEPVFGALFSIWLAGDRLTLLGWCGGGFIVTGMIVAEIWPALMPAKKLS